MSRKEKMFWLILAGLAGVIIGMVIISIVMPPARKENCNTGITEEVKDGVKIKTYIPAHDTCKEDK